jgi:putative redox protein
MPELTHVVTLAAPFDPHHVTRLFEDQVPEIREKGQAEVDLGGRRFSIGERFLTDLESHNQEERIVNLGRSLLIMHSPTDAVVGIENAGRIYSAAKHPKSFVALEGADHLLTDLGQARYAANVIASWS